MGRIEKKMKFAYFGYRDWTYKLLANLNNTNFDIDAYTVKETEYPNLDIKGKLIQVINLEEINKLDLKKYQALFFYGWSWILPQNIINNNICVCLHPSPLPKYRGGSPIQHQMIKGENESAVTLFKITQGIDNGPIYYQEKFSLDGDLSDILDKIASIGSNLTKNLIKDFMNNSVIGYPQSEKKATSYKRRKPEESELKPDKLKNMTARQIHDFIRALQDPYPNAYILGSDGKKVYLTKSKLK